MAKLPRGTTIHLATAFGTEMAITAASNAAEAVLTVPGHDFVVNDIVEVLRSGWGRFAKRSFVVAAVTGDAVTLKKANTSNTELFPAGAGVGTIRKATTFTQITQVTDLASSGGEPQMVEYHYLEDENNYSINNGFSAVSYTITLDADAIDTLGYEALESFTETQRDTVFRIRKKDGGQTLMPATVALSQTESYTDGQIITTTAQINGRSRPTRYKGV